MSIRNTCFSMFIREEERQAIRELAAAQGVSQTRLIREALPEIFGDDVGRLAYGRRGPAVDPDYWKHEARREREGRDNRTVPGRDSRRERRVTAS